MADTRRGPETSLTKMIGSIADEAGVSQETARKVIRVFLDHVAHNLAAGIRTKISNFGSFASSPRQFHNPETGETLAPVMWARWSPTGLLRDLVRDGDTTGSLEKRARGELTPTE